MSRLPRPLRGLLNLFYPPKCPFCGHLSPGGEATLCPSCRRELLWARQLFHGKGFDSGVFLLYYEGTVRESLLRYKFAGCAAYARVYGQLLAECIAEQLNGQFDLVSFIPVSRRRRVTRGYDQAELLAQAVANVYGVPVTQTLIKTRHNRRQSSLGSSAARTANVRGVYAAASPGNISGQRVLLIDDIVTTGATLSEAAGVLRTAGASGVVCAALAGSRNPDHISTESRN